MIDLDTTAIEKPDNTIIGRLERLKEREGIPYGLIDEAITEIKRLRESLRFVAVMAHEDPELQR